MELDYKEVSRETLPCKWRETCIPVCCIFHQAWFLISENHVIIGNSIQNILVIAKTDHPWSWSALVTVVVTKFTA